ncbi:hypothetical protein D018_3190, partial [Vibrio parahaemolyticus VP2007-007]
MFCHEQFS